MKIRTSMLYALLLAMGLGTLTTVAAQSKKRQRQGYLGVSIERISVLEKKELGVSHGVLVTEVQEDSPAEEAGLKEDDIILYFDGKKVRKTDDLTEKVRATEPGATVKVTLMRDGQRMDKDVKVGRLKTSYSIGRGFYLGQAGSYLGVNLHDMAPDLAEYFGVKEDEGVLILSVEEDSPAEKAGIKAGDVVVAIEDEEVGDSEDLREILYDFEEGDEVTLTLMRQKKRMTVKAELDNYFERHGIRIYRGGSDGVHVGTPQSLLKSLGEKTQYEAQALQKRTQEWKAQQEKRLKAIQEANARSVMEVRVI